MSVGYIEKFFGAYKPLLSTKVHRLPSPKLFGSRFDNDRALMDWCLGKTEDLLRKKGERCAALVMESGAQLAGGAIIFPRGYQREVSKLCRKYDVLLILDEIATGFGRLGNMVEYVAQRSSPDIACFGKALTGGYFPLAALISTDTIFKEFLGDYSTGRQFYHGHTFTGHPVGCAAALANLDLYQEVGLIKKIRDNGRYIGSRLNKVVNSPLVGDVRHRGMLAGIELARNGRPIESVKGQKINYFMMQQSLKRGIYLRPLSNIMMVIPPLAIGRENLDQIIDAHVDILREIERSVPQ
jgi:adenosylmethionine---8-amino-7-oxononanoate aminotransferase